MCDLAKERRRIDAILAWSSMQEPVCNSIDESELEEHCFAVLRQNYADACSDECMRVRCREFVSRLVRLRMEPASPAPPLQRKDEHLPGKQSGVEIYAGAAVQTETA
jgi:hypothetical protein